MSGGTTLTIPAADGLPLAATWYEPAAGDARGAEPDEALVVLCSATGVRRSFYDAYARFLAAQGLAALTFDYRGIGGSRPPSLRGFGARMRDWGERDLDGVLAWAEREHPRRALRVVGHSVGGQILGLTSRAGRVSAALFVAAQSGYYGHWPAPRRFLYMMLWHAVVPAAAALLGYFPSRRFGFGGEDLPAGVARDWARWCRTPHYMSDDAGAPLRPHFTALRAPILAYSFGDDPYATAAAVDALLAFYSNAPATHRHLSPREAGAPAIGHFGFFREGRCPELWAASAEWLRRPPLAG
jgi:predicted alpha/beta hydrolase